MKKWMVMLFALLLLPALALAEGPVLLVELGEDAQMVENVEFEDGDFVQTYQLPGGAMVNLLRYAQLGMTLEEMVASDWAGGENIAEVGCAAGQALRLSYKGEGQDELEVLMVLVQADGADLILSAVFPKTMGGEAIDAMIDQLTGSIEVMTGEAVNETAEVG